MLLLLLLLLLLYYYYMIIMIILLLLLIVMNAEVTDVYKRYDPILPARLSNGNLCLRHQDRVV